MKTLVFGFITAMVIAFVVGAYWNTEHHKIHAYKEVIKQYKKEADERNKQYQERIDIRDKRIAELETENESYNRFLKYLLFSYPDSDFKAKLDTMSFYKEFLRAIDSMHEQELYEQRIFSVP